MFLSIKSSRFTLKTSELTTVENAVTDGYGEYENLVDMEASALFEAGIKCIPAHRMVFLKIVSDAMEASEFSAINVDLLVRKNISEIARVIQLCLKSNI